MINPRIVVRKISTVLKKPKVLLLKPLIWLSPLLSDEFFVKTNFRLRMGTKLNLENPQTFNEKLQWLKLNYRKAELTQMVDKYEAKKYVANLIGDEHIIPTLGVWNSFDEIDFESLPNQFVLKTTHDQGGVVICRNKNDFDIIKAGQKIKKHLKSQHYYLSREWPYKNVKPRVIAEKYMVDESTKDLIDYKFFCFHGQPKALFVATERQTGKVKFDYFDMKFNRLNLSQVYDSSKSFIEKPKNFDKMIELASALSTNHPHVRVDFYDIKGKIYFGELTFFQHGGHQKLHTEEWDYSVGCWNDLPN